MPLQKETALKHSAAPESAESARLKQRVLKAVKGLFPLLSALLYIV